MKLGSTIRHGVAHPLWRAARATRSGFAVISLLVILVVTLGQATAVHAANTLITNCTESGLTSAISAASSGDTLAFGCSGTITLSQPITINQTMTIDGNGNNVTIDGRGNYQIFIVATASGATSAITFTLNGVNLAHGYAATDRGGAIYVPDSSGSPAAGPQPANIVVNDVTFTGNTAANYGGAIESDFGNVTVTNSTFSGSHSGIHGGAINNNEVPGPSQQSNYSMTLAGDTFTGNTAADGGAVALGSNSPAFIENSTFSGNSASGDGHAIYTYTSVSMIFSTVYSNATFAGDLGGPGSYTVKGDILDNASGGSCGSSNLTDSGYNIEFPKLCSTQSGTTLVKDPSLSPLNSNGGPTQTMAPLYGMSAAINGMKDCTDLGQVPGAVTADQRGLARPAGICDVGAYQSVASTCPLYPSFGSGIDSQACLTVNQQVFSGGGYTAPPNPAVNGNSLTLTNGGGQDASAFYDNPVDPTKTFSSKFDISFAPSSGLADGATFLIQSAGPGALGCNGGDLGVAFPAPSPCGVASVTGPLTPSIAVEFDLLSDTSGVSANSGCSSTSGQHVAIDINGDVSDATNGAGCTSLAAASVMTNDTVWVNYDGSTLRVYVAPQGSAMPSTPVVSYSGNLSSILGSNPAYVGFTGATGSYGATQQVLNWTFSSTPPTSAPTFTSGENGSYTWGGTTANPIAVTGTAPTGSTVALYTGGSCGGLSLRTSIADTATGSWSIPVSNLPTGASALSATATSSGSTVSGCSSPITINVDRTAPTSQLTSPALGTGPQYVNANTWTAGCGTPTTDDICGTASDTGGSGVQAVYVAIQNSNNQFWNGTTFAAPATWLRANGTTNWSLAVPRPADGVYTIASAAIDVAGIAESTFSSSIAGICSPSGAGGQLSINGGQLSVNGGLCPITSTTGSGQLSINGGQLSVNGGLIPSTGGQLSVNGGSQALTGGTCTLHDTGGNTATYTLSSANNPATPFALVGAGGQLSINGGQLSVNGGQLSVNGGQLSVNGGSTPLSTSANLNGGTCTVTTNVGSGQLSINGGQLSGNSGQLSVNGGQLSVNGGQLSVNGGLFSLNGGQLSVNGGVGSDAGNVVVDTIAPWVGNFTIDGQSGSGASNINPNATFHIAFDESMLGSTLNASNITVTSSDGSSYTPSLTVDPTGLNVSFGGSAQPFRPSTTYTVSVSNATDLAGNPIGTNGGANPNTFTFSTAAAAPFASTDTRSSDDDGDNIPNGWDGTTTPTFSLGGVSTNTAAWGFSPEHKDLCLVENYMSGTAADGHTYNQAISHAANQAIVNAFANSPVSNPDGTTGIHMVIFEGDAAHSAGLPSGYPGPYFGGQIPMVDPLGNASTGAFNWGATAPGASTSSSGGGGSQSFESIRNHNFAHTGLAQFCHYAVIAHTLGGTGSSGASRGIGSSDFVVALGGTTIGAGVGTQAEQQGTVMHELGHNLGLHHGGGPSISDMDINYKPDYMSVMNYFYQFEGVPGGFTNNGLDYSHGTITTPLNEGALADSAGLGSGSLLSSGAVFGTRYFCGGSSTPNIVANASLPINWGCSSSGPASTSHASDINGDGATSVLHDYNDWANISFNGGDIGEGAVPPAPTTTTIDIAPDASGGPDSAPTIESQAIAKFTWAGFFAPISSDTTGTVINTGKAGRTYPIKFQLKDATGNYVSTLSAVRSITYSTSSVCTGGITDAIAYSTTSSSGLHYDSTANQFVYNWATPSTAGCYMLNVSLADGTTDQALFSLS